MNVLSLFDGISVGQHALNKAGIVYYNYFASEIDPHAIKVTQSNFPNTIQLGDIRKIDLKSLPKIDLILAGSPCQGFSSLGNGEGFNHPKSILFFQFIDVLWSVRPTYFLLENVKMKKEWENIITGYLLTKPVMINSKKFTPQSRSRLYWTNIGCIKQPTDRGVTNEDIIDLSDMGANSENWHKWWSKNGEYRLRKGFSRIINDHEKSICMTARQGNNWCGNLVRTGDEQYRFINRNEMERLQSLPDNYTALASLPQTRKLLGNSWTSDVIVHIFNHMPLHHRMGM